MAEDNKGRVDGLFFNEPNENAPKWVIGDLNIPDKNRFIDWLQQQPDDRVKIDLLISKAGKYYANLNTYKPSAEQQATPSAPVQNIADMKDDVPF